MSNWVTHSIIGILLGILCVMFNSGMDQKALFAATLATILGAVIPDIDHKKSKIRGVFRWLMIVTFLFIIYVFLSYYLKIIPDISLLLTGDIFTVLIIFAISLFIASLITSFIESLIPRHRGPVHRIFASLAYSFLIFAVSSWFGFQQPLLIAFWGFLGYLSHIFMDILI